MFGNHKGDEVISIPEAAKLIREELDKSIKAGKSQPQSVNTEATFATI